MKRWVPWLETADARETISKCFTMVTLMRGLFLLPYDDCFDAYSWGWNDWGDFHDDPYLRVIG